MISKLVILFGVILHSLNSFSQSVSSREYAMTISKLLDHSVPELGVNDIDTTQNIIFLDARELEEYEVSHLKNAVHVGYKKFRKEAIKDIPKDQKIIVYCSVGYRSEKISEKLIEMGYKDVSNLYGGIFEWSNQQLPLFNDSGQTQQVHAYDKNWGQWLIFGEKVY